MTLTLAYAAHELRTPLATQRALLELALADPTADLATWREIGEDVLGACRQQERVLEACLALARSQAGPPRFERVDLADIAAEAFRANGHARLEHALCLQPAWVNGDPDLLERLAANLISNAIRHNVAGGRMEIHTGTEARRATLAVANTGRVISPGEVRQLSKPFQRFGARRTEGAGLGLAIVRAITDAHGADMQLHARAGGGLEIDVAFPALS